MVRYAHPLVLLKERAMSLAVVDNSNLPTRTHLCVAVHFVSRSMFMFIPFVMVGAEAPGWLGVVLSEEGIALIDSVADHANNDFQLDAVDPLAAPVCHLVELV